MLRLHCDSIIHQRITTSSTIQSMFYYTNQLLIFDTTLYKQPLGSGDLQTAIEDTST